VQDAVKSEHCYLLARTDAEERGKVVENDCGDSEPSDSI